MKEQRSICQAGPANTPGRLCRVRLREWQEHASLAQQCFDTTDCSMRSLSRSSAGTLYHQILLELTDRIESGEIGVGDRLPSEADLVVEFGVSRTMARRALDELRRQSLVRREPGRGTFLASPRLRSNLAYLHSFSEEIERWGYTPGVWLVSRGEGNAGEEVPSALVSLAATAAYAPSSGRITQMGYFLRWLSRCERISERMSALPTEARRR